MEPGPASRLTARKRRAVALIAISVLALAVAGLTWIVPGLHLGGTANSKTTASNPVSTTSPPPPFYRTLYDFATPTVGWALVSRPMDTAVFKTVDGGKHWRLSSRLEGNVGATIQFLDTTHGFVVTGAPNRLYRTTDGGAHWAVLMMPEDRAYGIRFSDRRRGSSLVPPTALHPATALYTTDDGGETWRMLPALPQDAYGPVFRNAEAWLSVSAPPSDSLHVYRSFDGGLAWSSVEVPRPPASNRLPDGPTFANAEVKLLPGAGVAVLASVGPSCGKPVPCATPDQGKFVSFDHGGTWTAVPNPPPAFNYRDIAYQDSVHWWALGSGSLFKSSDGGYTWQFISSVPEPPQGRPELHVFDALHAWAQSSIFITTAGGAFQVFAVVATSDGGLSWTRVPPPQIS